jgi:hypothetical protein
MVNEEVRRMWMEEVVAHLIFADFSIHPRLIIWFLNNLVFMM